MGNVAQMPLLTYFFLGLGWPCVGEFDGFMMGFSGVYVSQPYRILVHRKHPIVSLVLISWARPSPRIMLRYAGRYRQCSSLVHPAKGDDAGGSWIPAFHAQKRTLSIPYHVRQSRASACAFTLVLFPPSSLGRV